jgi:RHS repeat-associated protein
MPMPGRSYQSSNSYRYGFNGKENDLESGTQDYGMRIYNPALGKFLSVDPLSKSYPWNSTFAFAENSPIENIDLDGFEKHTIHVKDVGGQKQIMKIETDNSIKYIGISPLGIPIKPQVVQYITTNEKGRVTISPEIPLKNFGNTLYVGPKNPKDANGNDTYNNLPINSLDAAGYKHDKAYDKHIAVGATDAIMNLNVIDIDKQLVKDALEVVGMYVSGKTDPVNNMPVSYETAKTAIAVAKIFTAIVVEKSIRIGAKDAAESFKKTIDDVIQKTEDGLNSVQNSTPPTN